MRVFKNRGDYSESRAPRPALFKGSIMTTITIHSTADSFGNLLRYARIITHGSSGIVGHSVLLYRLTLEQRRIAELAA